MNSIDIDKELSDWEIFEKEHSVHIAGRDYSSPQAGVCNKEKGLELLREKSTRDFGELFSCKSPTGNFFFYAYRGDEENESPSNRYYISTKFQEKDWPEDRDQYEARIITYAKDIKIALLKLPALKKYNYKQPTEVFLNMTELLGRGPRNIVNVDDL